MMTVDETLDNVNRCWLSVTISGIEGCDDRKSCPYGKQGCPDCISSLLKDTEKFILDQDRQLNNKDEQIETLQREIECLKANQEVIATKRKNKALGDFVKALERLVETI